MTESATRNLILNMTQDAIWSETGNISMGMTHLEAKNTTENIARSFEQVETGNMTTGMIQNTSFEGIANNGTGLEVSVPGHSSILEAVILTIAATTATMLIFAIVSLSKCTKIPSQMKILSYNALLTDVMMHTNAAIMVSLFFLLGESFRNLLFFPLMIMTMTLLLISLASVAGLTLERLVALTQPLRYERILNKRNIALLSSHIWLTHSVLSAAAIVVSAWKACSWDLVSASCDVWYFYLPFRLVSITFFLIYHPFIVFSYLKITKSISRQLNIRTSLSVERNHELQNVTRNILRIVLAFEIIHFPIFVNITVAAIVPYVLKTDLIAIPLGISYFCTCSNSYFSCYTYVWKIKECRLMFIQTFFSWSERSRRSAVKLKSEVYNIVLPGSQSQSE